MTSRRLLEPVAKTLLDAADYIEVNGHYKGAFYEPLGTAVCIVGAIYKTAQTDILIGAATKALAKYLGVPIPKWNDAPERTAEEVIASLRRAALAPPLSRESPDR